MEIISLSNKSWMWGFNHNKDYIRRSLVMEFISHIIEFLTFIDILSSLTKGCPFFTPFSMNSENLSEPGIT
jgi:hypothetical protein